VNIRYDENGIPQIFCHDCEQDIEVSDLRLRGDSGLHCRHCDTHLGFMNDLAPQYQAYVIRG